MSIGKNKTEWESSYDEKGIFQKMEYPSEIVVSFVKRSHYNMIPYELKKDILCLDVGCGWGNNLRFLTKEGFDTYGVDFCQNVINRLLPDYGKNVTCCNFKKLPFPDSYFDFIVDRSSIQHNSLKEISIIHMEIYRVLKKDGYFFSSMIKSGTVQSGNTKFFTTYLSDIQVKRSLKQFSHLDLDYLSESKNNGKEVFNHHLIVAKK